MGRQPCTRHIAENAVNIDGLPCVSVTIETRVVEWGRHGSSSPKRSVVEDLLFIQRCFIFLYSVDITLGVVIHSAWRITVGVSSVKVRSQGIQSPRSVIHFPVRVASMRCQTSQPSITVAALSLSGLIKASRTPLLKVFTRTISPCH